MRLALRRRLAWPVLGGLLALTVTACSEPLHIGTAATVGSVRISEQTVREQVQAALAVTKGSPNQSGALARAVLTQLITAQLIGRLAVREHVHATPQQVRAEYASLESQTKGLANLRSQAASAGIPPGQLTAVVTEIVLENAIESRLAGGRVLATNALTARLDVALAAEARAVHIDVNPRFGTYSGGEVVPETAGQLASPAPGHSAE